MTGYFKGIVTQVDTTNKKVSVKILESVDTSGSAAGVSTEVSYQPNGIYKFGNTALTVHNNSGIITGSGSPTGNADWFDQQAIQLTNSTINWNNIAERPGTVSYTHLTLPTIYSV